jgi:alpha-tubulin suppressor-like RCC1 family protein
VSDAKAYCWGANPDGQLGNGTTTNSALPIEVGGVLAGKTVTDIEAGIHQTRAVADGSAYCWGNNGSGQLGSGTTVNSLVPVAVSTGGALSGRTVQSISTQRGHTCALADGQAFCWGDNQWGQLGNGTTTNSAVPVAVSTTGVLKDKTVTALSSGFFQSCAIADEKAYCWGYNGYGALGNNSTSNSSIPVAVYQSADGLAGQPVTDIDSRSYSSCAVAGGKAYCWGYNNYGPLGNDATNNRQVPIAVYADSGPLAGKTITQVRTGYVENGPYAATGCAIASDGSAACWGTTNTYGNLADGTSSGSKTPVAVDVRGGLSGTAAAAVATNGRTTMFLTNAQP